MGVADAATDDTRKTYANARLAKSLSNATDVFQRIACLVANEDHAAGLENVANRLQDLATDHSTSRTRTFEDPPPSGWALDDTWMPIVFKVASTNTRVLLAVGANALRVLAFDYTDLLEETWDPEFVDSLHQEHRLVSQLHSDINSMKEATQNTTWAKATSRQSRR